MGRLEEYFKEMKKKEKKGKDLDLDKEKMEEFKKSFSGKSRTKRSFERLKDLFKKKK